MKYYKVTLSHMVYVARSHCMSVLAEEVHNEIGYDAVDDPKNCNEFIAFEPLTDLMTVKGVDAVEALDKAFEEYRKQVEEIRIDTIKEYGEEEAEAIMDEEYGYSDLEETTIILDADSDEGEN